MRTDLESSLVSAVRNRQLLLWVCQKYDLSPGEKPHGYDLPDSAALVRYREEGNRSDRSLASIYWEAAWFEGARSTLLDAMRSAADPSAGNHRPIVTLASESESEARVSSQEFFPVCVLPGILDPNASPDARYGTLRARQRERVAFSLGARLSAFPGRVLVVLGAEEQRDLEKLYEVIEDARVVDIQLLVPWPVQKAPPTGPDNPMVSLQAWQGDIESLVKALRAAGAPGAGDLPRWSFRVRNATVELSADSVERIFKRFSIPTERDLLPPQRFELQDLLDFLSGAPESWAAFGAGLPVDRAYRPGGAASLVSFVKSTLLALNRGEGSPMTAVIEMPCEGGSGASTLLRHAAFQSASDGFPSLILRSEQIDIDTEDLLAFLRAISEAALAAGVADMPPVLIVLDVEHHRIPGANLLPRILAAHGRRAVILTASPREDSSTSEKVTPHRSKLRPLLATAEPSEVSACEAALRSLVKRWSLPLPVPTLEEWNAYEKATGWHTPVGYSAATSMFWVALRYFVTDEMEFSSADRALGALGQWVAKRIAKITDPDMRSIVDYVAVLSLARIVSPVWTVIRPVMGARFSSTLVETLKQIEDIVAWGEYSEVLEQPVLQFAHPAVAEEYLRQQNKSPRLADQVSTLAPVLAGLSDSNAGDLWVAESLSLAAAFVPSRQNMDWAWRLDLFNLLPPSVRDNHKMILHHWARCLYLSADPRNSPELTVEQQHFRLQTSIEKLRKALALPRRSMRDEHPSHLYNTLGVAYSRYARFLHESGAGAALEAEAWNSACDAFGQSMSLSNGTNLDAFVAFSQRLVAHGTAPGGGAPTEQQVRDLTQAVLLTDSALELLDQTDNPDNDLRESLVSIRADALARLNLSEFREYVEFLKSSGDRELGYYCEARLALANPQDQLGWQRALEILDRAESAGVSLGHRSLSLRISIMSRQPTERYNFARLRQLYQAIERDPNYSVSAVDGFRHAVLCYQEADFQEGAERFRRLRELARHSEIASVRVRDLWRDTSNPTRPRETQIRVTRVITEWRAEGYIDEIRQSIPLRPRHFSPPPKERDVVACILRFEFNGPLAVPPRFADREVSMPEGDRR
jgi:hypothetical protein